MRMRSAELRNVGISAVLTLWFGMSAAGGSLDPTNAPAPTMHTLEEIYLKLGELGGVSSPRTLSDTSVVVRAGYYIGTDLKEVDADLSPENLREGTVVFGVEGLLRGYPAPVRMTGQTNSTHVGDDGFYRKGVAWPTPRFTVGTGTASNCVTDNLTGLMWLRNPNTTKRTWASAVDNCEALDGGNGRGGYSDWRMPNFSELFSLMDFGRWSGPMLPADHPFTGVYVDSTPYWSSTPHADKVRRRSIRFGVFNGCIDARSPDGTYPVWPVRGGL